MTQRKQFGKLLGSAIQTIKAKTGKPIEVIQDELAYSLNRQGNSYIYYLRKGNVPKSEGEVKTLTRELIYKGGLSRKGHEKFLEHAGYQELIGEFDSLFSLENRIISIGKLNSQPHDNYSKVVGRQKVINRLLKVLENRSENWLIGIDGMGGIGKSAIAFEVGRYCKENQLFDAVIEIKTIGEQHLSGDSGHLLTFDSILDEIATHFHSLDTSSLKSKDKIIRVGNLLKDARILIILDNLETAREDQNSIISKLVPLLSPSKVLMTSRKRFRGEVFRISLQGLDETNSLQLIYQEATEKNIHQAIQIEGDKLKPIINVTGGSPLALKLVVGQLAFLSLSIILKHLSEAKPLRENLDEDEYASFYKHVFLNSWRLLSKESKEFLVLMSHFPPEKGGTLSAIEQISEMSESVLYRSIDQLWRFSLLEVGKFFSAEDIRYFLHSLTRSFVRGEIVKRL